MQANRKLRLPPLLAKIRLKRCVFRALQDFLGLLSVFQLRVESSHPALICLRLNDGIFVRLCFFDVAEQSDVSIVVVHEKYFHGIRSEFRSLDDELSHPRYQYPKSENLVIHD